LREGQHLQARRPPIEIRVRVQEQDQELDEVHHETFELLQVVFLFGQLGHSDRVGGVHFVLQIGDSLDHVCETAVVPGDDLLVVAHQLALEARRRSPTRCSPRSLAERRFAPKTTNSSSF
jgi:hypothetical protein